MIRGTLRHEFIVAVTMLVMRETGVRSSLFTSCHAIAIRLPEIVVSLSQVRSCVNVPTRWVSDFGWNTFLCNEVPIGTFAKALVCRSKGFLIVRGRKSLSAPLQRDVVIKSVLSDIRDNRMNTISGNTVLLLLVFHLTINRPSVPE